jgi:signal peptide peptidase SppA
MANRSYDHVLGFALSHPWNLEPAMLSVIAGVLARRIAGLDVDQAAIEAALVNRKNLPQPRAGSVAIIPVYGVLAPRMNLMSDMSGGTTYDKLTGQLRAAVADKTIKTVVLDIDSPGGSAAGNGELAAEIMKARTKKPIIGQAQYTMGSAAYQIGAACTEICAAPSAQVGSIGTYWLHRDLSEALKQLGIKETYISAGEGKVDGNSSQPLSEAFQARMQATIDAAFGSFVSNVVKGRGAGMSAERVKKDWKAHVYSAPDALANGMIDAIATLDDTIARLLTASPDAADQRAALDFSSASDATDQERPHAATSQERQTEIAWQNGIEAALHDLSL